MDQGELNLWVFVKKGEKFFEVTVNYKNGEIEDVESITKAEDLKDTKMQSQAMEKAKLSLRVATEKAVKENPGYRAVEITPELEKGQPIATVKLVRGQEFKEVSQALDLEERRAASAGNDFVTVEESEWDPWEPFNEKTFWFNRQLDRFVLKPIATAYKAVLPDPVRTGIGNALDNLDVVRRRRSRSCAIAASRRRGISSGICNATRSRPRWGALIYSTPLIRWRWPRDRAFHD